jgi:hypothetical protein
MDYTANLGSRRGNQGVLLVSPLPIYTYIMGDKLRTYIRVITSGRKRRYLYVGNSSRIPNLASEIGALCQYFEIFTFSVLTLRRHFWVPP